MNYPEPSENPVCQCRGNPMRAFFCQTGHMLECHYPYDCKTAACGHLHKYDLNSAELAEAERTASQLLSEGRLPPYVRGNDGGIRAEVH